MRAFLDISHCRASDKILNGRIFTCVTRLYKPQILVLFSVQKRARIRRSWPVPCKGEADSYKSLSVPGFYLEYLRGRSFLPKMSSFPQKILLLLQYRSNYIGESSRRDGISANGVSNPCLRTQLCLKMHQIASQRISIWKTELEDWARGLRPLGTSSPNEKS